MTITQDAKDVLDGIQVDREQALAVAKSIAQQVVDDSASTDTPLTGVVYAVWSLYNEGMPECKLAVPDGDGGVVFSGKFRTEEGHTTTRRRHLTSEELRTLIEEAPAGTRA